MTGSTPSCIAMSEAAQLAMRTTALCPSVTLRACTQYFRSFALRRSGATVAPRGGPGCALTANSPRRRAACRRLRAGGCCASPDATAPLDSAIGLLPLQHGQLLEIVPVVRPQLIVATPPVVHPRALAPLALIDGSLQPPEVENVLLR